MVFGRMSFGFIHVHVQFAVLPFLFLLCAFQKIFDVVISKALFKHEDYMK